MNNWSGRYKKEEGRWIMTGGSKSFMCTYCGKWSKRYFPFLNVGTCFLDPLPEDVAWAGAEKDGWVLDNNWSVCPDCVPNDMSREAQLERGRARHKEMIEILKGV